MGVERGFGPGFPAWAIVSSVAGLDDVEVFAELEVYFGVEGASVAQEELAGEGDVFCVCWGRGL